MKPFISLLPDPLWLRVVVPIMVIYVSQLMLIAFSKIHEIKKIPRILFKENMALSLRAVEYTNCIPAEG